MKTLSCFSFLALTFAVGCSSSSDGGPTPPADTGSNTDTATATDAADSTTPTDTATDDTTTPADTTTPTDTGTSSDAGGPSAAAKYFCDGYKSLCGFGKTGYFTDYDTCWKSYDGWGSDSHLCVGNELGKSNCTGAACTAAPCTPCK